ncbi:MAG: 3-phosphoshikimate 1-carboxyvinyltransferase [Prevotella sp.]|nr:3-phosphoshikimate 1-carboxyvinyltransferase [Prevotella sp.]
MQYTIQAPQQLRAEVKLPASKSISNRALIIHALSGGTIIPENLSNCDDTDVVIRALADQPRTIDIGAAGTAMRFMTAYLAATPKSHPVVITGTERMKHRPIGILVNALRQLGAQIHYEGEEGFPPLRIQGNRLTGGRVDIAGNVSSQFISALLLIGPVLERGLELHMTGDIISRPYIDLTLCTMREFGADADWSNGDTVVVKSGAYQDRSYYIENDWSASSYWYEAVALSTDDEAQVTLSGLTDGSRQGDSVVRYIFSLLGVKTVFGSKQTGVPTTVTLRKSPYKVPRLDYDFVNSPDLAQTFVVTCCMLHVPFHFRGLATLKIKETDRIAALKAELRKLGFVITSPTDSELQWDGERCEPTGEPIDTYEDHRMALAFAPAALCLPQLCINNPQVVSKSFPTYWEELRKAGFTIH